MQSSESIAKLAKALAGVQSELKHPHKNATNPHLRNTFADLNTVIDANRDTLAGAGLSVVQMLGGSVAQDGTQIITVTTTLMHESGEWMSGECSARVDPQKGINHYQACGIATTYLRRYGWQTAVGVNGDVDDDGGPVGKPDAKPAAKPEPAKDPFKSQLAAILKDRGIVNGSMRAVVDRLLIDAGAESVQDATPGQRKAILAAAQKENPPSSDVDGADVDAVMETASA